MFKKLKQNQVFPQIVSIALVIFFSVILINLIDLRALNEKAVALMEADSIWGIPLFFSGNVFLYVLLVPSTVLGAASGVVFGFWAGVLFYATSCFTASLLIFLLIRYLFKDKTQRFIFKKKQLSDIQSLAEKEGLRFIFFIRFLPVHATFINSLFAVSTIKPSKFLISCLFLIPEWFLHVYIGYVASITSRNVIQHGLSVEDYIRIILLFVSISAIVYLGWLAQKVIKRSKVKSDEVVV